MGSGFVVLVSTAALATVVLECCLADFSGTAALAFSALMAGFSGARFLLAWTLAVAFFALLRSACALGFGLAFAGWRAAFVDLAAGRLFPECFFVTSDSVSHPLEMSANFAVQTLQFIPIFACPVLKIVRQ